MARSSIPRRRCWSGRGPALATQFERGQFLPLGKIVSKNLAAVESDPERVPAQRLMTAHDLAQMCNLIRNHRNVAAGFLVLSIEVR